MRWVHQQRFCFRRRRFKIADCRLDNSKLFNEFAKTVWISSDKPQQDGLLANVQRLPLCLVPLYRHVEPSQHCLRFQLEADV